MATPPKKATTSPKAPAKTTAREKASSPSATKTAAKKQPAATASPKAAKRTKTGSKSASQTESAAKPVPTAPTQPAPTTKTAAPAETAPKTDTNTKPAGKPKTAAKTPDKQPAKKDVLTAEERERSRKLKATLALLKEDPEWPAFLREQREALLALRDELAPNVHSVTRDHLRSGDSNLSSSSGQHIGDAGSDAEVRALTIRLLDKDREQLFEIDAALERIRRGTYGICEISLEPIPKGRLRVRPFCRLTVKCQEEYEKKYGSYANYRAKNQDSVGFAGVQNDEDDAISLDDSEE